MEYRELAPPADLAGDVACLWYDSRNAASLSPREQRVLPDGCIDIVWWSGAEPRVAGPATASTLVAQSADLVLGVRFAPGRASAFLGLPAYELLDQYVPLDEVWGEHAGALSNQLHRARPIGDRLGALVDALRERRTDAADPLVTAAVRRLRHQPDVLVRTLGDELGVSERQLLRRFTAAVGYGPRVLGRVLRFRRFVDLVSDPRTRAWDLARLAAEAGYADQAHLARECSRLAAATPSSLRP